MGRRSSRGDRDEESARGDGTARLAQDERLARHAHQRTDTPAMVIYGSQTCCSGFVARDRAARAEARDVEVVEGRATRCLSRLQPEREGPHYLLGLLDTPAA